jgi:hypothetical protein
MERITYHRQLVSVQITKGGLDHSGMPASNYLNCHLIDYILVTLSVSAL